MDSGAEIFEKRDTEGYKSTSAEESGGEKAGSAESDADIEESGSNVEGREVLCEIDFDTITTTFIKTMIKSKAQSHTGIRRTEKEEPVVEAFVRRNFLF
jgi:hypothetical protein